METDRNLLFGVLALQAGLIDAERFVEACTLWSCRRPTALGDCLVERGWLSPKDRENVDHLLELNLNDQVMDARAWLGAMTTDPGPQPGASGEVPPDARQTVDGEGGQYTIDRHSGQGQRYTLTRVHAQGGIGQVWLARDNSLGREVALKELRPERARNTALWGRFLREAQVTGQLEHPGIVPIYELGRHPDQAPFYAMRFVRGRTLAETSFDLHARRQRGERIDLELRELLTAFVGVCNAVAYAHSRGVLHRDLKPQNVVLGDFGEALVLDWGLARLTSDKEETSVPLELTEEDGQQTMQGQVLGTPAYMPPEQAEGRLDLLDARSDVYGLGAILYELLTGHAPYTGNDVQALLQRVIRQPPASLRSHWPDIPRPLEAVCLKALAKVQADRYHSAKELADEVRRWLADEPVGAYPEPLPARAGRWARRHRTAMSGTLAALIATLVGLGMVLGVQSRANAALRAANQRERERFELAERAIQSFHTGVSEDVLLKNPELEGLRNRLLRSAADFYRQLEDLLRDESDIDSRVALGRAYDKLAQLTQRIGDRQESLAVYERGLAVWEALAADDPATPKYLTEVAGSLEQIGNLHKEAGRHRECDEFYQRALAISERLVEDYPDEPRYQQALASSRGSIGKHLRGEGDLNGALASYRQGLELLQELVASHPGEFAFQDDLATLRHDMALVLDSLGHKREALQALEEHLTIRRTLFKNDPTTRFNQVGLAHALTTLGQSLEKPDESPRAIQLLREGLALREQLVKEFPAVTNYQSNLASSLEALSTALEDSDASEALKLTRRALAIRQKLSDAQPASVELLEAVGSNQLRLAKHLSSLKQFPEAVETAQGSLALWERASQAQPGRENPQSHLADVHLNLALAWQGQKKPAEAREAYQKALDRYQRLIHDHPDSSEYLVQAARCHLGLGEIHAETGKPEEALKSYGTSLELLEPQVDRNPSVTRYQEHLAVLYNCLVLLHADQGRSTRALAVLKKEVSLRRRLVTRTPTLALWKSLGQTEHNLGHLLAEAGDLPAARAARRRSLAIWQRLHEEAPHVASHTTELIDAYTALAFQLASEGKQAEALKLHQCALALRRRLLASDTEDPSHHHLFLEQLHLIGWLQCECGRPADSLATLREAVALSATLMSRHPSDPRWLNHLSVSHRMLGSIQDWTGQTEQALASARQAVFTAEQLPRAHPEALEYQNRLAHALQSLSLRLITAGQVAEAVEMQRRCVAHRRLVADAKPSHALTQQLLREAWLELAHRETEQGRIAEALLLLDRVSAAVARRQQQAASDEDARQRVYVDAWRGRARRLAGQGPAAAADLRRAVAAWNAMPYLSQAERFERARCLAQLALLGNDPGSAIPAAEAAHAAHDAIATLADLAEAGWCQPQLLARSDFDGLRKESHFRKLLDRLAFRQGK